jgi:hypothetical protein
MRKIKFHHKIISEVIKFPDRTSEKFYNNFNSEFLLSLGVLPNDKLLSAFYEACTYLAWAKFEDTNILEKIERKKREKIPRQIKKKLKIYFTIFEKK